MSPKAFDQKVILTSTKSLKSAKTVMTSATFKKNKINAKFAKLTGAKGYQVQIKKGGKTYKYFTTKTSIKVKAPKAFKKKYNVSFSYDIDNYTSKIEGKPAYISVRPYKIVKKNKKGPFGIVKLKHTTGKLKNSRKTDPTDPVLFPGNPFSVK